MQACFNYTCTLSLAHVHNSGGTDGIVIIPRLFSGDNRQVIWPEEEPCVCANTEKEGNRAILAILCIKLNNVITRQHISCQLCFNVTCICNPLKLAGVVCFTQVAYAGVDGASRLERERSYQLVPTTNLSPTKYQSLAQGMSPHVCQRYPERHTAQAHMQMRIRWEAAPQYPPHTALKNGWIVFPELLALSIYPSYSSVIDILTSVEPWQRHA